MIFSTKSLIWLVGISLSHAAAKKTYGYGTTKCLCEGARGLGYISWDQNDPGKGICSKLKCWICPCQLKKKKRHRRATKPDEFEVLSVDIACKKCGTNAQLEIFNNYEFAIGYIVWDVRRRERVQITGMNPPVDGLNYYCTETLREDGWFQTNREAVPKQELARHAPRDVVYYNGSGVQTEQRVTIQNMRVTIRKVYKDDQNKEDCQDIIYYNIKFKDASKTYGYFPQIFRVEGKDLSKIPRSVPASTEPEERNADVAGKCTELLQELGKLGRNTFQKRYITDFQHRVHTYDETEAKTIFNMLAEGFRELHFEGHDH